MHVSRLVTQPRHMVRDFEAMAVTTWRGSCVKGRAIAGGPPGRRTARRTTIRLQTLPTTRRTSRAFRECLLPCCQTLSDTNTGTDTLTTQSSAACRARAALHQVRAVIPQLASPCRACAAKTSIFVHSGTDWMTGKQTKMDVATHSCSVPAGDVIVCCSQLSKPAAPGRPPIQRHTRHESCVPTT